MRIVELGTTDLQPVTKFGSVGFGIGHMLSSTGPVRVSQARLTARGVIGRHPAVQAQMLIPVEGTAVVSGAQGETASIGPSQAAVWDAGELHETRTENGLWALIVEGPLGL